MWEDEGEQERKCGEGSVLCRCQRRGTGREVGEGNVACR